MCFKIHIHVQAHLVQNHLKEFPITVILACLPKIQRFFTISPALLPDLHVSHMYTKMGFFFLKLKYFS